MNESYQPLTYPETNIASRKENERNIHRKTKQERDATINENTVNIRKVKSMPPGTNLYQINTENENDFKIGLHLNASGHPEVQVNGSTKKFVQYIHQAVLNFMREYSIPVKIFCRHVLQNADVSISNYISPIIEILRERKYGLII